MLENFQFKGIWWLPEKPENQLMGILSFNHEDKIKLDIIGSFNKSHPFEHKISDFEIILGITDTGKKCTLYKNFESHSQMNYSFGTGIINTSIETLYLFIGKHFSLSHDILFTSCKANFTNLESWMSFQPFKINISEKSVSYSFPDIFEIELSDFKIKSDFEFNTTGDIFKNIQWHHKSFLEVITKSSQDFKYYKNILFEIKNLLTLLVGQAIFFTEIIAVDGEKKEDKEVVKIFFTQKKASFKEKIHPMEMILPLPKINEKISVVINLWFSKTEKYQSVFNLFFGTFYNPSMYLEFHFLSLIQALESFHRVTKHGKYLDDEKWKPHKDKMLKNISSELDSSFKDSLKSRIKYGNEYSLRKRMDELVSSLDDEVRNIILPSKNYYSGIIIDTRNYFTHYDNEAKDNVLHGSELYYANQRLKILLILLLLKELGIEEKITIQSLYNCNQFNYLLNKQNEKKNIEKQEQEY